MHNVNILIHEFHSSNTVEICERYELLGDRIHLAAHTFHSGTQLFPKMLYVLFTDYNMKPHVFYLVM